MKRKGKDRDGLEELKGKVKVILMRLRDDAFGTSGNKPSLTLIIACRRNK